MNPLTPQELGQIHDPKSIKHFKELFHSEDSFYSSLDTDPKVGVRNVAAQHEKFGNNKLPERLPKPFWRLIWEALQDRIMIILSIAAVVSLALGLYEYFGQPPEYDAEGNKLQKVEWIEGVAIMIAVVVVVLVGAANDYQKELQFAKLNAKKEDRDVVVVREGVETMISIHDLCVGDVLCLSTGEVIPADCVLIHGECECDESSVTGESDTIRKLPLKTALQSFGTKDITEDKHVPDCMLISGSRLLSGLGRAVVTAVGVNSMHGRTMQSLQVEPEPTPLQQRLTELADNISKYGSLAAGILFIVLFCRFLSQIVPKNGSFHDLKPPEKGSQFLKIFIVAVTIVVVAVPEGLPLAVTLALAFATTRMTKDGNLVRVLRACETMGSATAVCTDKTGTLTKNRMTVVRGLVGTTVFEQGGLQEKVSQYVNENIAINSTAFVNHADEKVVQVETKKHFWSSTPVQSLQEEKERFVGSKTEVALLTWAQDDLGLDVSNLQQKRDDDNVVQVIPFESSRKWGGVVVKTDNGHRLYVKGASELICRRCSDQLSETGDIVPLGDVFPVIESFANDALRTIAMAHKDIEWKGETDPQELFGEESKTQGNNVPRIVINNEQGFILECMVGIMDPLRDGVTEAVSQCQRAGVTVRMVTGDNVVTAKAIAKNCGILKSSDETSMEGPVFRKLTYSERVSCLPKLRVLARSSPEDKRILVDTLKKMGDVVAVTGDGTNDAPALKLADVGFSMGIAGTEVAREASDIILMTDDFGAIVNAIKWGRCVSVSIKKFIQFQLTVNITAVILTFVSAVASSEEASVLTAVQLLWVNLIMDTLAALALATDKPDKYILDRKPKGRHAPLISVSMWKMILGQSTLQLIVTMVLHFAGKRIWYGSGPITGHQQEQLDAMTFNTFVWLQIWKLIVTRKLDEGDGIRRVKDRCTANNLNFFQDLFRNQYFLVIILLIGGCQVLIMFIGGAAFSIVRQTGVQWAVAIVCGLLSLPVGLLIRMIPDEWAVAVYPAFLFNLFKKRRRQGDQEMGDHGVVEHAIVDDESVVESKSKSYLNPLTSIKRWRTNSHTSTESTGLSGSATLHSKEVV